VGCGHAAVHRSDRQECREEVVGHLVQRPVRVWRSEVDRHHQLRRCAQAHFEKPDPKCWLHHQGSFITSFFPKDAKPGVDYSVFYMPGIDPQYGKPVLFSGDLMVPFTDRPEVRAVESFFSSAASVESWVKAGGALPLQKDASLDWYSNDVDRSVASVFANAESVRFDGSDLMPGVVGAGTFFKGMSDYIAGTVDLDAAMTEVQAGWANVKK